MPGKTITTRYPGNCADCGAIIPEGTLARYYGRGHIYGIGCHEQAPKLGKLGKCEDAPCCGCCVV